MKRLSLLFLLGWLQVPAKSVLVLYKMQTPANQVPIEGYILSGSSDLTCLQYGLIVPCPVRILP